jgi:hypothetical protein
VFASITGKPSARAGIELHNRATTGLARRCAGAGLGLYVQLVDLHDYFCAQSLCNLFPAQYSSALAGHARGLRT